MKKITLLLLVILLTGCASYKFKKAQAPDGNTGYVVAREEKVIPEYTAGKDNSLPDLRLAEERFKRRKGMVEYYYKRMDSIQNRFHEGVKIYGTLIVGMATSLFRLPFVAISDYRYEHNPQYRTKKQKFYEAQDAAEEKRIASLQKSLNDYLQKDFTLEEKNRIVQK
jgi:hypothetical protein